VTNPTHALDKRTVDQDGRLRVPGCRISKAVVNPYFGREIPNFETLGLDPDRVYLLYRDPEELRKAAPSFEGVPLLDIHIPVTADAHVPEHTVGTLTNPRFDYPYLVADLVVWTDLAKAAIDSGEQRELSCAYRYVPVMRSGYAPDGCKYDGVMTSLSGNHLALVSEGRAGPDVMVADEKPIAMKFPKFLAAVAALVARPADAALVLAADSALAAEIEAMDADLSDEDKKAACDAMATEKGCAADALSDEDKTEAYRRAAADKRAKDTAGPGNAAAPAKAEGGAPKPSMDEAAVKLAVDSAVAAAREGYEEISKRDEYGTKIAADAALAVHALYAAREAVAEKTGLVNITEYKTAEAVYCYALDKLTVPHKDVPAEALAALYTASSRTPAPAIVTDAAPFNARDLFPSFSLISRG
jgi:hypothetical protein